MVDIFWSMSTKQKVSFSFQEKDGSTSFKTRSHTTSQFSSFEEIQPSIITKSLEYDEATWLREQQSEYLSACCMTQWAPSAKLKCAPFSWQWNPDPPQMLQYHELGIIKEKNSKPSGNTKPIRPKSADTPHETLEDRPAYSYSYTLNPTNQLFI